MFPIEHISFILDQMVIEELTNLYRSIVEHKNLFTSIRYVLMQDLFEIDQATIVTCQFGGKTSKE